MQKIDPRIKDYATEKQRKYIDAVLTEGSIRAAMRTLGVAYGTVQSAITAAKQKAAMAGLAPEHDMTHPVPEPYVVKGVSTLYDQAGNAKLQWVKTKLDENKVFEALKEWVQWLVADAKGLAPKVQAPKHTNADLLAVYPMGDPHFGMYAWALEAGEDFDSDIAERLTRGAIDRLVEAAPPAKTALIAELGDMFHADNTTNRTPQHGHALDVDTRWMRVMQIGLRSMIYVILRAAEKHEIVIVRIVPGNHDPHASFMLALALDAYFHGSARIKVDLSPAVHWYYKFGQVLIGVHHGDTTKMKDLAGVMASDRPKEWGETKHRYWYGGHVHHKEVDEFYGVICESFRTLAPRDAWHASQGYRAGRDMCCIVHHAEHGEIERHRCDIGAIKP